MRRALPSINRLLATLTLVCVLPVSALFVTGLAWTYSSGRDELVNHAVAIARALTASVDERLNSVSAALTNLSRSPALGRGDLPAFREEAAAVAKAMGLRNIVLVDGAGRQLVNTRLETRDDATPGPPGFGDLTSAVSPRVLDLFRSQVEQRWVAGVGLAVHYQGRQGYALAATIEPAFLESSLARQRLPSRWIAAVLDARGIIVARTLEHERFVGTPARAALVSRIRETPEDAVESVTVDGIPVITAFSRSEATRWSIAIGIPRADLIEPLHRMTWLFGAGAALVLATTLAISRRLATRISGSLHALGVATRSAGHGTGIALPEPEFLEAAQLGQALLLADAAMRDAQDSGATARTLAEAAIDACSDPVVFVDDRGFVLAVNPAAQHLLPVSARAEVGVHLDVILPPAASQARAAIRVVRVGPEGFSPSVQ